METKKLIVLCFLIVVLTTIAAFLMSGGHKDKHLTIVAKFPDAEKYVVVRDKPGAYLVVKVDDKTFNHLRVGDSILYTGN